jgi:hypothetical protein
MNATQNAPAAENAEKTPVSPCQPLIETLSKLGSAWAAHGLKIGRNAVQMSAETLQKTVDTLDTLAAEFEKRAAKDAAPAGEPAPAAPAPAADAAS